MSRRLSRRWFARDASTIARALLGCRLVRVLDGGERLAGTIVETEAYVGIEDRASHAYAGRRTPRNEAMYARAGTAYVYFTYGMHHCFNVVCGKPDEPVAVLIRALEPTIGLEEMRSRRPGRSDRELCSGPGRLAEALGISLSQSGRDLLEPPFTLLSRPEEWREEILTGPRIGISKAVDQPWRFCLSGSRFTSLPRLVPRPAES